MTLPTPSPAASPLRRPAADRPRRSGAFGAVLAALASPSCLVLDGFSDLEAADGAGGGSTSTSTSTAPATSTSTDGAGGTGAGGGPGGGGGAGGGPSERLQVYVSQATGSDAAGDGLSPEQAKLTIHGALSVLDALGAEGDVLVCEGTYDEEELVIDRSISVLGGFDCDTWARPQQLEAPYFERVVTIAGRPGRPALTLDGPAVDGSVSIEGVTIRGGRVAVDVVGGAAPRIEKSSLQGGAEETGPAIGLRVDGSPRLDRVQLTGGVGTSDGTLPGSAGMVLVDGAPVLEETIVTGGTGDATGNGLASVGLLVLDGQLVGASTLRDLQISGGSGTSTNPALTTAGIAILGGDVDIESVVVGGGTPTTASSGSVGVLVRTTGAVTIARSLVNGGTSRATTTSRGVHALAAASLVVENCAITGGLFDPGEEVDVATIGVHVDGEAEDAVGEVTIVHSTIQAQHAAPVEPRRAGPIVVGLAGPVTIGNDLLFTAEDTSDVVAITFAACPVSAGEVAGNAFFWISRLLADEACDRLPRGASSIGALESQFAELFTAQGNVYLGACEPESSTCDDLDCAGPEACLSTVFDAGTLASAFLEGFALAGDAGPPCSVGDSSEDYGVAVDWSGDRRDAPPSRGADEAAACVP